MLAEIIQNSQTFKPVLKQLSQRKIQLSRMNISALSALAYYLFSAQNEDILILCPGMEQSERIRDDLFCLAEAFTAFFPHDELLPFDEKPVQESRISERQEALWHMLNRPASIVVCDAKSFSKKLIAPESFKKYIIALSKNEHYEFEFLQEELSEYGFERADTVEKVGQFAIRGGIIDVFPFISDYPVRIEFFGDTVESIRYFDLVNQRSIREIDSVTIYPNLMQSDANVSLLNYLQNPLVIIVDYELFWKECDDYFQTAKEIAEHKGIGTAELNHSYFSSHELKVLVSDKIEIITNLIRRPDFYPLDLQVASSFQTQGDFKLFLQQLHHNKEQGIRSLIACDFPAQKERLLELLDAENSPIPEIMLGTLFQGFHLLLDKVQIINEHEIFHRLKRKQSRKKIKRAEALRSLHTLNYNDYVVHVDYGISQFKGLEKIKFNSAEKESVVLLFQNNDKVYVSIDKIYKIQKYASEDANVPALSRLGGKDWDRLKQKTRQQIETVAKDLVQLYAERSIAKKFRYDSDSKWQIEMEAAFPYEDTADQAKATLDVKRDMESKRIMDRLICGDVGFGKTEIAIRAAFKAVQNNKQVAVLVPTTILAQQHDETFTDRLKSFPVRIASLSRFRSVKEQKDILDKLSRGEIDIIIGTHRLTSDDVQFHDLGLLIIDEEQRFGVKHKEKLKDLKKSVDCLTLTATPIPRTLQQSIVGVKEISNIETPPMNRLPIKTEILTWDEEKIYTAIMREIERGGQVFFVHNRVESIEQIKIKLQGIVPKVSIKIAHGQMNEKDLERVMNEFSHHQFDLLLSTMIIENGLDIPNVNSILVHHADRLGLAQLYQLRGRVGRSDRQAYAYLIVPQLQQMSSNAIKRLEALEEYSELGSGVKISIRDMEIRGAGSLLGHQQSGHINAVGYEMYLEILEEKIAELKAEIDDNAKEIARKRKIDTQFDADCDHMIPLEYVTNPRERMTLYHRLVNCDSENEIQEMREELIDRYGKFPVAAENLLLMLSIRNYANRLGVELVEIKLQSLKLQFSSEIAKDNDFIQQLIKIFMHDLKIQVQFVQKNGFQMFIKLPETSHPTDKLQFAREFLSSIKINHQADLHET